MEKIMNQIKGITPENRGHKPQLSPGDPTIFYGIKMPESLWDWCKKMGPVKVRKILEAEKKLHP